MAENKLSPVTSGIRSVLARHEVRNFLSADATVFWRPRLDFLTGIVLRVSTRDVRDFDFPKKGAAKSSREECLYDLERFSRISCDAF